MMNRFIIPQAFIWRRLHSLTGVFLVLFLILHLLTNSQAALFIGNDGQGFINDVNSIHDFPYLPVIEIVFLGVPFLIHMFFGIRYLLTGESNFYQTRDNRPNLGMFTRNRAYTWQRVTSWFLLVFVIAHVVHMRFLEYPTSVKKGAETFYMVDVTMDEGLLSVADRLNFSIYDKLRITNEKATLAISPKEQAEGFFNWMKLTFSGLYAKESKEEIQRASKRLLKEQKEQQQREWLQMLEEYQVPKDKVVAVSQDFGTAELIMLRETFKSPVMIAIYSLFVLFASYHAFNGLWTAMISWGFTLTDASQQMMLKITTALMVLVSFLGLAAVFGTYYINLKY